MKNTIIMLTCLVLSFATYAQEEEGAISIAVIESYDSRDPGAVKTLAALAQERLSTNDRIHAIDRNSYTKILEEQSRQHDEQFLRSKIVAEEFNAIGATHMLITKVLSQQSSPQYNDGKLTNYKGEVSVSLTVVDVSTTATKHSETFRETGYGSSGNAAILKAIESMGWKVDEFFTKAFPIEIRIVKVTDEKNGKLREALVSAGEKDGVKQGDIFDVVMITPVDLGGGQVEYMEDVVGNLKISEVKGDALSTAKPTKGAKEIFDAISNAPAEGAEVVIRSNPESRSLLDKTFKNVINNYK
ncbi:MAG: hypothetical protein H6559_33405 [Lewinellaceae bacterium]|nr:hypothetical protein [Lewinellaceae bacterium]